MRTFGILAMLVANCGWVLSAQPEMISVTEHNGATYVAGTELARAAAIAIKKLPGSDSVVACSGERCARLKDYFERDRETFVGVAALSKSLGLSARFSDDRRRVRFDLESKPAATPGGIVSLGELAPNFQLTKLGGGKISLADLRGKRVLINSWASW